MKNRMLWLIAIITLLPATLNAQVVIQSTQGYTYTDPTPPKPDRQTGPFMHLTIGLPTAIAFGNQITPSFMLAGGIGFDYLVSGRGGMYLFDAVPLFAETRISTRKYNFALFLDLKAGVDLTKFGKYNDLLPLGIITVGMNIRDISLSIGQNIFRVADYYGNGYYRYAWETSLAIGIEYRIQFRSTKQ